MLDDDDDFDVEDVDFSCFNDQNVSNIVSGKHSFCLTSPQRKSAKKHALDFVHSLVDETPSDTTSELPLHQGICNVQTLSKNNNHSPRNMQVTKRKFPGPAGLLPEKVNFQSMSVSDCDLSSTSCVNITRDKHDIELASSQYGSIFETIAWKCAQQDIEQSGFMGITNCNVAHLKRYAFSSKSKALKYPFLVLAVTNMNTGQELFVSLQDSSGVIQAHINSEVLEQFPTELSRGSVIVLKKVGVLKTGQARGVSLLITPNNLAVIYPPDSGISKLSLLKDSCQDVEFSIMDVSLNSSLDTSFSNNPSKQSLSHNRTANLESRNLSSHSTPNSYQQKRSVSISASPRTSTPIVDHIKKTNPYSRSVKQSFQPVTSNQSLPTNPSLACDKQKMCTFQSSSNLGFQSNQYSENNQSNLVHSTSGTGPDSSVTLSILTQNGISQGEDLSSTVNSLLEGLEDSIFDDF